jgi:hypothetical protein
MASVIDRYRGSQDMGWVGNLRRIANPPAEAAKRAVKRRLPTGAVAVGTTVAHRSQDQRMAFGLILNEIWKSKMEIPNNHAVPTDRVSARMAPAFLCRLLCACAIPKCAMLSLGFSQRD